MNKPSKPGEKPEHPVIYSRIVNWAQWHYTIAMPQIAYLCMCLQTAAAQCKQTNR